MQKEFDKITLMYDLEHRWERYEFFVKKKEYEFALNELLMGYGVSDKQMDKAKELGIEKEYTGYVEKFRQALSDQFNVSPEQAIEVYKISNRKRFTIAFNKILKDVGLDKASKYKD